MHVVAHETTDVAVDVLLHVTSADHPEPLEEEEHEHRVRPDRQPDEVRHCEQQPEEDRQPRPPQVVGDDEADGMRRHAVGAPPSDGYSFVTRNA